MTLSKELARFVGETTYDDLPEEVVSFTKLCLLDWFGNAIAGSGEEPVKWMQQLIGEMGGTPQATTVHGEHTSVLNAALVNGAASHIVELDDIHKGSVIHAATVVIPAAVACAEWKQSTGKELITAVALGYDVCYRIGEAVTPSHYYFWHNTATCGTFGAAVAVAKLLNLDEEQIAHALGSAGTQAAGLWEFIEDGAMSKQLHTAKAAYNGMLAALLSQKGFTAATAILEGKRGFFQAMSKETDWAFVTQNLGQPFKIVENSFKIHASCRHTHAAVDVTLDLIKGHSIQPGDIQSIEVNTYQAALNIAGNPDPKTIYSAKFSIAYCVALAIVKQSVGLSDFNQENLNDPIIHSLLNCSEVQVSKEIECAYPEKWGAEVILTLKNGEKRKGKADFPKGDPENPVSEAELVQKFKDLTLTHLQGIASEAIQFCLNLETTNADSMVQKFFAN